MYVECLHPKIFVNPAVLSLIAQHGNYVLDGRVFDNIHGDYVLTTPKYKSRFTRMLKYVTMDNIDNYYVQGIDGYKYPIFMASPCGKCMLCINSAHNSIARRLAYESQLYNNRPWFVTLTYHPKHLPKDGVSVRDCQLFFKRFRQNLERVYGQKEHIRYYLVSDYGQDDNYTLRPHYHVIIFNIHSPLLKDIYQVRDLLHKSWHNGFVKCRVVDMSKPSCFYYTSKYVGKVIQVPEGKNPVFALSSRGKCIGGIGAPFIKKFAQAMYHNQSPHLCYVDRFTGKVKNMSLDSYTMSKLLPTFNQSVKLSFRNHCQLFSLLFNRVRLDGTVRFFYNETHTLLKNTLGRYLPLLVDYHKVKHAKCVNCYINILNHLQNKILQPLQSLNFQLFNSIHYARKTVYQRLFATVKPLTYDELVHKANLLEIQFLKKQQRKLLHNASTRKRKTSPVVVA